MHDTRKKADLLSVQFKCSLRQAFPSISQLHFDTVRIAKLLSNVDVKKAVGPDQIPCWVLKNAAQEIAPFLQRSFSLSLKIRDVPQDSKKANIHAIFKNGDRSLDSNYGPSPSLLFPVRSWNTLYLVILCPTLKSSRSCLISSMASANLVRVKPNYSSPSKILLETLIMASKAILSCWTFLKLLILSHTNALRHYGVQGTINKWIQIWLCYREQSLLVEGEKSAPVSVISGVPQVTVLGP